MSTKPKESPAERAEGNAQGEQTIFEGRPAAVRSIGALLLCIITVGLAYLYFKLRQLGIRYKITTQRVVVDQGMLSKKLDQLDLARVTDYQVERPFGQRLLGTGNIVLQTMDRTTPVVRIDGLRTDVVALYERLRQATEAERRARGVRVVDYE